jgi:hypothetical protein
MGQWKTWRWAGILPLATLIWHGTYTSIKFGPQYLLFACYPANLLLGLGVLTGMGLCSGIGAFFALVAFPLYLFYAATTLDWALSGSVFHVVGAVVGGLSLLMAKPSRYTWVGACLFGILLHVAARVFTDPEANVNIAFDTFSGRNDVFASFPAYLITVYVFFGLSFFGLQVASNHYHKVRSRREHG